MPTAKIGAGRDGGCCEGRQRNETRRYGFVSRLTMLIRSLFYALHSLSSNSRSTRQTRRGSGLALSGPCLRQFFWQIN